MTLLLTATAALAAIGVFVIVVGGGGIWWAAEAADAASGSGSGRGIVPPSAAGGGAVAAGGEPTISTELFNRLVSSGYRSRVRNHMNSIALEATVEATSLGVPAEATPAGQSARQIGELHVALEDLGKMRVRKGVPGSKEAKRAEAARIAATYPQLIESIQ